MSSTSNPPDRGGRPVVWTPDRIREATAKYLDLVADGWLDTAIHALPDMPSRPLVQRWMSDVPGFGALVARARRDRADALVDQMVDIADAPPPPGLDGAAANAYEQQRKARIGVRQFVASKAKPEVYGEHKTLTLEHKPLQTLTLDELMAIAAQGKPLIEGTVCAQSDDDEVI